MRKDDIRFNGKAATIEHHSARGRVTRNAGNFTRGSQLVTHEFWMWFAGVSIPLKIYGLVLALCLTVFIMFGLAEFEFQMILMRLYSTLWTYLGFDPQKIVHLTLPGRTIHAMPIGYVPFNPFVDAAWQTMMRILFASLVMSAFITAPLTMWYVDFSRKRGKAILQERHERGAMLVTRDILQNEVRAHNSNRFAYECQNLSPPMLPADAAALDRAAKRERGIHQPYKIAGIAYPWRLEQSHTMLIGTTGAGKTTQLRSLVKQLRERGHSAVIFDLTGAFVESFYNPETDVILNPMDQRCRPWTIFNDCDIYADFLSAATALIPSDPGDKEPFWQLAARTLFVEICIKLKADGETSNAAIAHHLMTAELKRIHAKLEDTVAAPLTTEKAARMAESIRSVFNTNGNVLRFLPDPVKGGPQGFSIADWMTQEHAPGSIMFITSNHTDLTLTRPLLTLWMDLAVNSLMRLPRTRDLRTWFLFDEVHALHALPAIEHGLQTARNFGGAFVLGIHSFDKLVETYGEQGAVSLTGLARTKLILATADYRSAERCAEFIGNREVRQMDEAYSYGYNNTRDASTLTPRKMIEPLVIPDDITNLPSMHGFIKFPDGFPAARIKLQWQDYPQVAEGFVRVTKMEPTPYVPPKAKAPAAPKRAEEGGEGGREHTPLTGPEDEHEIERAEPGEEAKQQDGRSEAELAAEAMVVRGDLGALQAANDSAVVPDTRSEAEPAVPSASGATALPLPDAATRGLTTAHVIKSPEQIAIERAKASQALTDETLVRKGKEGPEEQILRETREGAGVAPLHPNHHHHREDPAVEAELDDGMEM